MEIDNSPVIGLDGEPLMKGASWGQIVMAVVVAMFRQPVKELPLTPIMADTAYHLLSELRKHTTAATCLLSEVQINFLVQLFKERGILYLGGDLAPVGLRLPGWRKAIGAE